MTYIGCKELRRRELQYLKRSQLYERKIAWPQINKESVFTFLQHSHLTRVFTKEGERRKQKREENKRKKKRKEQREGKEKKEEKAGKKT